MSGDKKPSRKHVLSANVSRSVKEDCYQCCPDQLYCMSQHSSSTANIILTLHRPFLSVRYLSRLCFSSTAGWYGAEYIFGLPKMVKNDSSRHKICLNDFFCIRVTPGIVSALFANNLSNNVLVSKFTMNAARVYRLSESSGVSRAHLHLKCHARKPLAVKRAVFGKVKGCCFYTTIETF